MKVLLDACVWGGAAREVSGAGHDAEWAGAWSEDPGDEEILRRSHAQGRVLITLDKDFGEIAIVRGVAHSGIVRLVDIPARGQGRAVVDVLSRHGAELARGAIVTMEAARTRVRLPD